MIVRTAWPALVPVIEAAGHRALVCYCIVGRPCPNHFNPGLAEHAQHPRDAERVRPACTCGTPAGEAGGDAWKCATRRGLPRISCPCACHRYVEERRERDD